MEEKEVYQEFIHLGHCVRRVRQLLRLSPEELADKIPKPLIDIIKLEESYDIEYTILADIARAMHVTTDLIMAYKDNIGDNIQYKVDVTQSGSNHQNQKPVYHQHSPKGIIDLLIEYGVLSKAPTQ